MHDNGNARRPENQIERKPEIQIRDVPERIDVGVIRNLFLGVAGLPPLADKVVHIRRVGKPSSGLRHVVVQFQDTYASRLAFCYSKHLFLEKRYELRENLSPVELAERRGRHTDNSTSSKQGHSRIVGRSAPLGRASSRTSNQPAKHGSVSNPRSPALPAGSPGSQQCCWDHVKASEAGHVDCLRLFRKSGRFLPFGSPDRTLAGEARRDQAWQAASAACRANRSCSLRWLLASGWPTETEELAVGHLQDTVSSWEGVPGWEYLRPKGLPLPPLHELNLYRWAMKNLTPTCLEVLLEAGCCSPWICAIAADENRADFLALAAERGCPCRLWAMPAAARSGNPAVVRAVHQAWRDYNAAAPSERCVPDEEDEWIWIAVREAARLGLAHSLEALLRCFGEWWSLLPDLVETALMCAARGGHVECLDVILRLGIPTYNGWHFVAADIRPACLDHLRPRYKELLPEYALEIEAVSGQRELLKALHDQGFAWSGNEPLSAAKSGSVAALEYCLENVVPKSWIETMEAALRSRSPGCVQVLFDRADFWSTRGMKTSLTMQPLVQSTTAASSVSRWFSRTASTVAAYLTRCLQGHGLRPARESSS
eukprot:jgi/Botrbrau1/15056/Bobra.118_2s0004.1